MGREPRRNRKMFKNVLVWETKKHSKKICKRAQQQEIDLPNFFFKYTCVKKHTCLKDKKHSIINIASQFMLITQEFSHMTIIFTKIIISLQILTFEKSQINMFLLGSQQPLRNVNKTGDSDFCCSYCSFQGTKHNFFLAVGYNLYGSPLIATGQDVSFGSARALVIV